MWLEAALALIALAGAVAARPWRVLGSRPPLAHEAHGAPSALWTPLLATLVSPSEWMIWIVAIASLAFLGVLGAFGAAAGGASPWKPTVRVVFWGALAMAITAAIGALFGTVV